MNQSFSKIWIIIIILIVGGILAWQYFWVVEKAEAPQTEVIESAKEKEEFAKLTLEALENAEYYFALYDKKTRLIGGRHDEEEIIDEDGYSYIFSAGIISDKVVFGDLNYDEKEDAIVILYSEGGGSGFFYELAVIINENGSPYHLTSKYLGDRVRINSLSVKEDIITLDVITHDTGDAACCPTLHRTFQYKLFEDELLEI